MTTERNYLWLRLSRLLASARRGSTLALGERWGGEEWSGVRVENGSGWGLL
jgi:hypothetical protein